MEITVEVGGWEHTCCGPAIERNQLVELGCIRTTGPDGQAVISEVGHDVDPPVRVHGRVVDLLVARPDGTSQAIHRVPSGAELTPLDQQEVVLLQQAWTLTPVDAGTEFLVVVQVAGGPVDL